MKKYKLLKDLPGLKTGTIFEINGDKVVMSTRDYKAPVHRPSANVIQKHPDWFEKVKEEVHPLLWKPEKGETYFFLEHKVIREAMWLDHDEIDKSYWLTGNCFPSEELAQASYNQQLAYMEYIRAIAEFNEGWEPDWSDDDQAKWHTIFSTVYKQLKISVCFYEQAQHEYLHYKSEAILEKLIEKLGEDKIKLALGFK